MANQDFRSLRVLVVDDEPFMRQLLVRLLDETGIPLVETASNGMMALEALAAAEKPFDLVICDLSMPGMSGLEMVSALRTHDAPTVRDVPVIILTGHSQRDNVLAAVQLGISGFLVKPVSRQKLAARIRTALERPPVDPLRVAEAAEIKTETL